MAIHDSQFAFKPFWLFASSIQDCDSNAGFRSCNTLSTTIHGGQMLPSRLPGCIHACLEGRHEQPAIAE